MKPEQYAHLIGHPDANGCWPWLGSTRSSSYGGYGRAHFGGVCTTAHRAVWQALFGDLPRHLVVDHLCRNRACVNPDHLEPVTTAENTRRGIQGARTQCKHGHTFDEKNTRWHGNTRQCRECTRIRTAATRARQRLARSGVPA